MLRRVLLGMALMVAVVIGMPNPANAASFCGNTCDGQDPSTFRWQAATCASDVRTVRTRTYSTYMVELRYSPRCATAWARTTNQPGYWIDVNSYYLNGNLRRIESTMTNATYQWTPMVNDQGLLAEACIEVFFGDPLCTTRY